MVAPTTRGRWIVALRRLCKAANSFPEDKCPAVYVEEEDPSTMVGQGRKLSAEIKAELRDLAAEEDAVRIPTETVLRAVGLFLAEQGRPVVLAEVEAYLRDVGR
jgi:hypothetical protein